MKINFMMMIVTLSFFTILGVLGAGYYTTHEAVAAGLQQCNVEGSYVWQKECK